MTSESSPPLALSAHAHYGDLAGADDEEARCHSDGAGDDHYGSHGKPKQKFRKSKKRPLLSPLLVFSFLSFSLGLAGLSLSAYALLLRPLDAYSSLPGFLRCRGSEDTARVARLANSHRSQAHIDFIPRPRLLGVVGVQTSFFSRENRMALRDTWFPAGHEELLRLEHATGLAFRFVIGRTNDAKKNADLQEEVDKYNDFLLLDIEEEEGLKLPYKTLAFFKAAFDLFDAEFYVKLDDGVYLRPDRLATLLARDRINPATYIGCMKKGSVVTDPKMKWYEPAGHLLGKEYFYHAYGPLYALSAEVVAALANTRNDSLRIFSHEDVTIGLWMLAMNVNHEDSRAMCDSQCTPTSIAVWDVSKCSGLCNPVDSLRELHKTSMCSKSPTMSPDGK
ncbi:putative beta-1-3-galactosyltransferase 12 [Nymphaea thermarum]|nr:putative beta-1-3-galactosyltransferase 12 [Nymphaea thermarum]